MKDEDGRSQARLPGCAAPRRPSALGTVFLHSIANVALSCVCTYKYIYIVFCILRYCRNIWVTFVNQMFFYTPPRVFFIYTVYFVQR